MKSYEEYEHSSTPGAPFSNSTDSEAWKFSVCRGGRVHAHRCVNDDIVDAGEGCPLILLSLSDRTPVEWTGSTGTVINRCTEKTTPAEARAAAAAAEKARVAAEHYPLFDPEGL